MLQRFGIPIQRPKQRSYRASDPYRDSGAGAVELHVLPLSQEVIYLAKKSRADKVLQSVLKHEKSPEIRAAVTQHVFAYYRWFGWLDPRGSIESNLLSARELNQRFHKGPASFAPDELHQRAVPAWAHEVATLSPDLLREFQSAPRLWLRTAPGEAVQIAERLGECSPHPVLPDALWYRGSEDLFRTAEFHAGQFEVQDLSSQITGLICAPKPGQTWWDACAGEGGKTLHLGAQMQNRGLIWASDRAEWRLALLKRRAARAKIFNYRIKPWVNPAHLPVKGPFDGVLVDAPCSGIGTWGRNPHARWTLTRNDVEELAVLQKQILGTVASSVKTGGRLIYSVCTLAAPETTEVAAEFDRSHPEFKRIPLQNPALPENPPAEDCWLLPHELNANGMFIAAWEKVG